MKFEVLLALVGQLPLFDSSLLLAGGLRPEAVRLQLSRWKASGRILQLRRGLYVLAPPYQKVIPHPFVIANSLARPSYVSLQSALAHHGLIPEDAPVTVSVTRSRPARFSTPLGDFIFHHVRSGLLAGYKRLEVAPNQWAFVARPEKALCDLVYLTPGGDDPAFLQELRLQNLALIDAGEIRRQAAAYASPKLLRAAEGILSLAEAEAREYATL